MLRRVVSAVGSKNARSKVLKAVGVRARVALFGRHAAKPGYSFVYGLNPAPKEFKPANLEDHGFNAALLTGSSMMMLGSYFVITGMYENPSCPLEVVYLNHALWCVPLAYYKGQFTRTDYRFWMKVGVFIWFFELFFAYDQPRC